MGLFLSAFLLFVPFASIAQSPSGPIVPDPAQQASQQAQQAMQQAQAAAEQAQRDSTEASRQAADANRKAMDDAHSSRPILPTHPAYTFPPKFSLKPGHYKAPITLSITTPQRDATIYYTLDGWKPSTASLRYRGPIVINQTTTVCAIVVVPDITRSIQASAQYVIDRTTPLTQPEFNSDLLELPSRNGVLFLPEGLNVPLAFTTGATSQVARVGDHVTLALTQDLKFGNTLVASKGASAAGTVVLVNRSGIGGAPGTLVVELDILNSTFGPISLDGSVTKEGDAKLPTAAFLIPVFGETQVFRHGSEAVIAPGAFLVAFVARDTPLTAISDH